MKQISPAEAKLRIQNDASIQLVDVREADEFAFVNLGGIHMALSEFTTRFPELNPELPVFTLCHHGMRSLKAALFLESQGFKDVSNIQGGIDAWSLSADTTLKRY